MTLSTLPRYLIGSRDAILEIAGSRRAMLPAILFVFSAALAREYDQEDLLAAPWHLLRPLAASFVTGTILFVMSYGLLALRRRGFSPTPAPPAGSAYATFLTLYWMTAPLAWLYAIPVERMMTLEGATAANITLLGIVAFWRVFLIARVIAVLYGVAYWRAFAITMLFADGVAFAVAAFAPAPVFNVMGGIHQTAAEQLAGALTFNVLILSVLTAPIWFFLFLSAMLTLRTPWPDRPHAIERTFPKPLLRTALASILFFLPILFLTQPEQRLRTTTERTFREEGVEAGLRMMSAHERADFPPHWEPPLGMRSGHQSLIRWPFSMPGAADAGEFDGSVFRKVELSRERIAEALRAGPEAEWVEQIYLGMLRRNVGLQEPFSYQRRMAEQTLREFEWYSAPTGGGPLPIPKEEREKLRRELSEQADWSPEVVALLLERDQGLNDEQRKLLERAAALFEDG